jgi:hypothetical protein
VGGAFCCALTVDQPAASFMRACDLRKWRQPVFASVYCAFQPLVTGGGQRTAQVTDSAISREGKVRSNR